MSFIDPNKSGLEKAVAILGTVFLVSLGLCGLNFVSLIAGVEGIKGVGSDLIVTGYLELAGMLLSAAGLLIVAVIAIARAVIDNLSSKGSGPVSIIKKDEEN